ncbi:MAG: ABC transporter permease [Candidatus Hermodarchaeota archaeon]
MGLRSYLGKRVFIALILFFTILIFNFFLFRFPVFFLGMDPMNLYIEPGMQPDAIELLRKKFRIPEANAGFAAWFDHFLAYMQNTLILEFGQSFLTHRPVQMEIVERLPNTVVLMGSATIISITIGVVTGVLAASRHGNKTDTALITVGLSVYSLPVFWIGMILLLFFAFFIPLFPLGHSVSYPVPQNPIARLWDFIWHLTLPCATLSLGLFGNYMLLMRNTLVEVLTEDYILTARAKGLAERMVLFKHGLRNAFLPLITVIAISFAFIVTGSVLVETVFSWHGMGRLLFKGLMRSDWPVCQAIFWLISLCVIAANIIADLLYGILDPRIKYG